MNTSKKISLVALLSGMVLFSGCLSTENTENTQNQANAQNSSIPLKNIVSEVQKRSAYFSLEKTDKNTVSLILNNPKQESIQSFTAEILFPPHLVQVKNLKNTSEDIFALSLPSDWNIDTQKGVVKIASAFLGSAQKSSENKNTRVFIAQFEIEKQAQENSFVLDINENVSNIFVLQNNVLQSIVNKKQTKDLIIK